MNAKVYTCKKVQWTNELINTLGVDLHVNSKHECVNFEKNYPEALNNIENLVL